MALIASSFLAIGSASHVFPFPHATTALYSDPASGILMFVLFFTVLLTLPGLLHLKAEHTTSHTLHALVLFAALGMAITLMSRDLLTMLIGMECTHFATLPLLGAYRTTRTSLDSVLKQMMTGMLGSLFLMVGILFVSLAMGGVSLHSWKAGTSSPLLFVGMVFLLGGFGYKMALAPFHMWQADAFEQAPAPLVALLLTGPVFSALWALQKITTQLAHIIHPGWLHITLAALAAGTMVWGHIAAIGQREMKRMLVFLSMGQMGCLLLSSSAATNWTNKAILLSILAWCIALVGASITLSLFEHSQNQPLELEAFAGLAKKYPLQAVLLSLFLLSLSGLPLTVGFVSKWMLLGSVIAKQTPLMLALALFGLLSSLAALYASLRVIFLMFLLKPHDYTLGIAGPQPAKQRIITFLCVANLLMGILPPLYLLKHVA
jgi:NADH-quinone oxidoreductase subunit N